MNDEQREIVRLYRCGNSMQGVASILGVPKSRVCRTVRKAGASRGRSEALRGPRNPHWNKGIMMAGGYVRCLRPDHPRSNTNGYVLEHILVAERMLGRRLSSDEEVHHKDRRRANNAPSNLLVLLREEHIRLHIREGDEHAGEKARQTWLWEYGPFHGEEKQYWQEQEEREQWLQDKVEAEEEE